jgi:hypothetical protein
MPTVVFRLCRQPTRAVPGRRRFPFYERRQSLRLLSRTPTLVLILRHLYYYPSVSSRAATIS